MATLDSQIDDLYAGPLESFVSSRNALARSLTGADRDRVKTLEKPNLLAWLANQTYWHARDVYDRLLKAGAHLRSAQVGALERKSSDVRAAMLRHRDAVAQAVTTATKLGERADVKADRDGLRVLFDALSTRNKLPQPHGRITKPLPPAGFESLAGFSFPEPKSNAVEPPQSQKSKSQNAAHQKREEQEARKRAEEERRQQAAIKKAEAAVAELRKSEETARRAWERATQTREEAEQDLAKLRE